MATYLRLAHTDTAVQNAFASASEYVQQAAPRYKAYQATQNVVLTTPQGTFFVDNTSWIVRSNDEGQISVYTDAEFSALYEAAP